MQCLGFILKYCGLISIPELDFALVAWEGRNGKLGIGNRNSNGPLLPRTCSAHDLKGYSQLIHMRIRCHMLIRIITRYARETDYKKGRSVSFGISEKTLWNRSNCRSKS